MASRLIAAIEEPTMSRLQNKLAVITGATSGNGLAAAQRFGAEGTFVYMPEVALHTGARASAR
jgi:NAD(P)-dependent dehydrogenase (short-subunit alcohol dehydrogenase family)